MIRLVLLLPLALALAWPRAAVAERIFYRGGVWLETSAQVQRLSLHGVLRAWERLAEAAPAGQLSLREREALRLQHCLTGGSHSFTGLLERVTAFSFAFPDRLYYSLSDFITEGLRGLCPGPSPGD